MTQPLTLEPQAGYYKCRLVRGGPWLPAVIWWHTAERGAAGELLGDEGWRCEIDGDARDPYKAWMSVAGRNIAKVEFLRLTKLRAWADKHARNDPYGKPGQAVDLNDAEPIF